MVNITEQSKLTKQEIRELAQNKLSVLTISKLSVEDANTVFRAKLNRELLLAPHGQEPNFQYATRIILAYYQKSLDNINRLDKIKPNDKSELQKSLAIKYIEIIQQNHEDVDALIKSAHEIENLYTLQYQR